MTIPLALFASSYNEEEANGSTVQNSKSSYTPVKNNKNNYILQRKYSAWQPFYFATNYLLQT
jgi:hypothetical protein